MRVLFVDTLLAKLNFQPLGILSLAAMCRNAGHTVRLADMTDLQNVARVAEHYKPDVIGFEVFTGTHAKSLELCQALKKQASFFSVFGGPHATYFPQLVLEDAVDAVCRGEAERSFVDFLNRFQAGEDYEKTPNFVFKSGKDLKENAPAPLIEDLDSLPFGAWEILDEHPVAARFPVKPFMASRGCPYACAFCYNPALRKYYSGKGKLYRRFSPQRFVNEVAAYKKRAPLSFVYIFDDTFATSQTWLEEFCALYKQQVDLPFFANFTADKVSPEQVALLKKHGLAYAGIGLESGNEEVRRGVMNKKVTNVQIEKAAAVFHENGIPFEFYNILGIPGTSLANDFETLSMNARLRPTVPEVMVYQPYPGTPLGDQAAELGLFSGNPEDIPETFKSHSPLAVPHSKKIKRLFLLFRFLVAIRASRKTATVLTSLPLDPLYWLLNRFTEGFVKSRKIYKIDISLRDYLTIFYHYLRS